MASISRRAILASTLAGLHAAAKAQGQKRKSRADSFFGIHLDLHPGPDDKELGKDLSEANINRFLTTVRPDYVQYDCKGHAGWLGYPSKVSSSAPGIVRDSLALWREMTEKQEVALYIHFSGVWDSLAILDHPEWARIKPDRTKDDRQTSLWSTYADDRMIPQLLEVSEKYRLDGAWIDGECWQTNPDYSAAALADWRKLALGLDAPSRPEDPHWEVWLEFNRQRFRTYVRHYLDVLHAKRPGFQIASNWLYTTFVPEKPDLPVDFLSGDYLGNASLTRARLDARYLARSGKPWDLMAWGFQIANTQPAGHIHKPAVQLQQEAAVVLAQGGGFQIYYQPSRAGRIDDRHIDTMSEVAQFCRLRQALSHKSESASDVAILFSRNSLYRKANKLFGGWGKHLDPCTGLLDALIECHLSVDVMPDWAQSSHPTLVIPEWEEIGDQLAQQLAENVRNGLKLFLTGAATARKFAPLFGWKLNGAAQTLPAWVSGDKLFGIASGLWQDVEPAAGKVIANRYATFDSSRDSRPAAISWNIGKGKVVLAPGPIGQAFELTHSPALREFVSQCMAALGPAQVEIADTKVPLEIVLRRQEKRSVLHLLNHSNKQVAANFPAVDYIATLPAQQLRLRLYQAPKKVSWEPDGVAIAFEWKAGYLSFNAPPIAIHAMAVIE